MSDNSTRIYLEDNFWYQLGYTGILRKKDAIYGIKATKDGTQVGELVELEGGGKVPIATLDTPGIVKPDGLTIVITEDGTISADTAEAIEECRRIQEETIEEVNEIVSTVALEIEPI